jgi:DNA repair protein RadD
MLARLVMVELRPYQNNALAALETHWRDGGGAALIDMATATGKSLVIAETLRRDIARDPNLCALVAVHVRELVEQDVDALLAVWPDAPYGICSDGLGRRDHDQPIIFGTIQTLHHDIARLGRRDLLLIDEVQLVPRDRDGMYLTLIDALRALKPDLRMVGASATCFRLDSGYLDRGEGALFERTVFSYGIADGIRDGWLVPLSSKATKAKIDVNGVGRRGGEFIPGELERAANVDDVVEAAVAEMVEQGADRRAWIGFCCGVEHAYAVRNAVRRHGISCETVVASTPSEERKAIFDAYRAGKIRCLTGVNVFSVGFNIPQVDLIALLRPTCSPGLLMQQVGRGTRKAEGKIDCRVLDFAGNIRRHGPVDSIHVNGRTAANPGDVLTKTCPECQEENLLAAAVCSYCGHVFVSEPRRPKHAASADLASILSGEVIWLPVRHSEFRAHQKLGDPTAPPTLRVDHLSGFSAYSEYVSFQSHNSGARYYAGQWWHAHGGYAPVPMRVADALARRSELNRVTEIVVDRDGKWWRIARRRVQREDGSRIEVDSKYRVRRVAA